MARLEKTFDGKPYVSASIACRMRDKIEHFCMQFGTYSKEDQKAILENLGGVSACEKGYLVRMTLDGKAAYVIFDKFVDAYTIQEIL